MTKTKSTKRALLLSALSLLMCVSMLIGSTFAWFTDSVTSAGNKIVAGALDVQLLMDADRDGTYDDISNSASPIFGEGSIAQSDNAETLWEPGKTQVAYLAIKNNGNLDLKYTVGLNVQDVSKHLYEVMEYAIVADADKDTPVTSWTSGKSVVVGTQSVSGDVELKAGATHYFALAIHMDEQAGNEYQGGEVNFDLTVLATQLASESDSFDNQYDKAAGTFVGGKGTAEAPYLINEASQLLSISNYDEYTYFKVADGVETLDMTGVGKIKLNGSFDGNGVTMNNLTTALFQSVGKSGAVQNIKISNLTANVHVTDGSALVKNIYNPGETTFENVTLHGYIEGQYNMGSFYNYGTANAGDSDGADYTVNFVNTKSDATLVCTTGNAIGGMLGHGYEGANYKLSIKMDANSGYTGNMYTTGTATCYKVMAMCSHGTYVLNGKEVSRYQDTYSSERLTVSAPKASGGGYYVTPAEGVDHYVVYLNSQLTAYDASGNKIANKVGMTWNLGKETIASDLDGKVFDLIKSAKIVNSTANDLGYAMSGGELTIYSGRSDNYASGWVTLQVNQYDADGDLLATGITTVHTFAEPQS